MSPFVPGLATGEHSGDANLELPPPNSPESQCSVHFAPLPPSQPESRHRWRRLEANRDRWNPNTLEPMTGSGISPLLEFTERIEGHFYCKVPVETGMCNYKNMKRGRMLSHIRKEHLKFRPFPCGGQCGTQGCPQRFPAAAALKEHADPRKVKCNCGKVLYAQNFNGHQAKCVGPPS